MTDLATAQAGDEFMRDMASIKMRYPGLQGLLLYQKVVEHWQLPGVRCLKFFEASGKELLTRHTINKFRGQTSIVEEYTKGVLEYGVQPHCRGNAIAVPRSQSSGGGAGGDQAGHATLTGSLRGVPLHTG